MFGNRDSTLWTVFYFSSNFIYIALILIDKVLKTRNKQTSSILISSVAFQIFYALFLIFLGVIAKDHEEFIRKYVVGSWSLILALVAIIYFITIKTLTRWEKK
jgi:hypothetical protein